MNKNDLTVITVVENDKGLLDLMIQSVYKFTNPKPKIIICDQGRNGKKLDKYRNDENITIVPNKPDLQGGSNKHSSGLNKIFPMVKTTRTAIVESDCIILREGWDDIYFPKYKMLASKKGEIAGHPFYHVCFMVFSTNLLKHNGIVDFRPGKEGNRSNRPYLSHEDVGWSIRNKVDPKEVKLVDFVDCKSGKGYYFNEGFQSDEFWVDGLPTIAHFGRGSNLAGKAVRKGFKSSQEQLKEWKKIAERIIKGAK